jgi:Domain of unknown function (DUF4304)
MPAELDAVKHAFFDWGRENGFTRRSRQLSRPPGETSAMLELQRSDYSHSYYINVGFAISELHGAPVTLIGLADILVRAGRLIDGNDDLRTLLNLETDLEEVTRKSALAQRLDQLLPILAAASTLDGLRSLYARGLFTNGLVKKEAVSLLSQRQ